MSDTFWKIGTTFNDDLFLATPAAPTGKTGESANLAIRLSKDGVGNQATTGITITEVDAVNNPGLYHITGNATTSFIAVAGEYALNIRWTTDTTYEFTKTIVVTADGTGAGSTGLVSYTATASDGRITDGTSALSGATVVINTPAGVPYVSTTSSATGVWGPIYFPASMTGTWPVYAFKSGYSTVSFSITTTATLATGPLTDEALTAINTGTGLVLSDLMSYGRYQIRQNVGTSADAQLKSAINDALAMLAKEYLWSWLKTDGSINLNGYYSTGTITITGSGLTVTLTGGTWPSWAASGKLMLGGKWYRVSTRDSTSQLTMLDAYNESATTSLGYVLFQDEYTLATDCLKFGRFWPGFTWGNPPEMCSFETLREYQNTINTPQNYPTWAAIHANKAVLWPYPTISHDLRYLYHKKPATLSSAGDVADWDAMHLEVLQRAIDYQLAIRYKEVLAGDAKDTYATYKIALAKAITNDKESAHRPDMLHQGRRPSIGDRRLPSS